MPHAVDRARFRHSYRTFIFISECAKKEQKWKVEACKIVLTNHLQKGIVMALTSLVISILALLVAYCAFKKSGGSVEEMKRKVEDLGATTETFRKKTADIIESLEKRIRGEDKKSEDKPHDKDDSQQAAA
jgi:hypothetical protein